MISNKEYIYTYIYIYIHTYIYIYIYIYIYNNCEGEWNKFCNLVSVPDIMNKNQIESIDLYNFQFVLPRKGMSKKNCYSLVLPIWECCWFLTHVIPWFVGVGDEIEPSLHNSIHGYSGCLASCWTLSLIYVSWISGGVTDISSWWKLGQV